MGLRREFLIKSRRHGLNSRIGKWGPEHGRWILRVRKLYSMDPLPFPPFPELGNSPLTTPERENEGGYVIRNEIHLFISMRH